MAVSSHLYNMLAHIPVNNQYQSIRNNLMRRLIDHTDEYIGTSLNLNLCILCGNNFEKSPRNQVLIPTKKMNRFLRRQNKRYGDYKTLYQMRSMQKFNKYSMQQMVKYCQLCKFKSKKIIENNNQQLKLVHTLKKDTKVSTPNKRKMRKKKNKNNFAGLKTSAVLSVKRARDAANNPDYSNTPKAKKAKLDNSVIELDTPRNEPVENPDFISLITPNSKDLNTNNIGNEQPKNPSLNTPKKKTNKIKNKQPESPDFISLTTPKKKTNEIKNKQPESPDFISLTTPKKKTNEIKNKQPESPDFISLTTPKKKTNKIKNKQPESLDFISLVTPKRTSPKSDKIKNKQLEHPDVINLCTPNTSKTGNEAENPDFISLNTTENTISTPSIDLGSRADRRKQKKASKKLRKSTSTPISNTVTPNKSKKSAKKGKKLNTLSSLLSKNNELNNTISNLERFLNSVPTAK